MAPNSTRTWGGRDASSGMGSDYPGRTRPMSTGLGLLALRHQRRLRQSVCHLSQIQNILNGIRGKSRLKSNLKLYDNDGRATSQATCEQHGQTMWRRLHLNLSQLNFQLRGHLRTQGHLCEHTTTTNVHRLSSDSHRRPNRLRDYLRSLRHSYRWMGCRKQSRISFLRDRRQLHLRT